MQPMDSTFHVMKPLVAVTLIALLVGTRFFCDLGTSLSLSQCCAQTDFSFHHRSDATANDCPEDHDRDCSARPSEAPKGGKSDQCCTNWFVFTAEPTKMSIENHSNRPIVDACTLEATMPLINPVSMGRHSAYPIGRNRAPNNLHYLATHPIRV